MVQTGVGIDKTREGWLIAKLRSDNRKPSFEFHSEIPGSIDTGLIDIPIGLPDDSRRNCDQKAINILKPDRHYSVFYCPVRDAVYTESYEEACRINELKTGHRISKQSWNLCPAIKQIDRKIRNGDNRLKESHPEICFKTLGSEEYRISKKSEEGIIARKKLLEEVIGTSLERSKIKRFEDALDALVLAYTDLNGYRTICDGTADSKGIEMNIRKPKTSQVSSKSI